MIRYKNFEYKLTQEWLMSWKSMKQQDDFEVDEEGDRMLPIFVGKMPGSCNIAQEVMLFDYLWNVKNHAVNVGSEIVVSFEDCWNPKLWLLIGT